MKPLVWDRDPVGAPFVCTFLQSRNFRIVVPKKVFNLAERLATQRLSNVQTSLVARVILPEQNRLEIVVNRIECPLQPCPRISSLTDELLLPIELLHRPKDGVTFSEEVISSTKKTILSILNHAPTTDLCNLFTIRTRYLLNTASTHSVTNPLAQFCVDAVSIDCPMRFQRVQTLKLISSALARSLETNLLFPMASSHTKDVDSAMEPRFGYLSVTNSNEFSVHLDSDPSALSANLAGLWISGIPFVKDPRVWAACFRFLLSKQVKRRYIHPSFFHFESGDALHVPNVSMFLLFYGTTTGPPACYEVDWEYDPTQSASPYDATQLPSTSIPGDVIQFNLHRGMGRVHSFSCSSNTPEMYSFDLTSTPKDPLMEKLQSAVKPYLFSFNTVPLELGVSIGASMSKPESSYVFSRNSIALSNPSAYEDPFSLSDTQFNVPDASLLFEEGVATSTSGLLQSSHSQNELHSIVSQTSVEYSEDAIPRQPPCSSLAQSSVEDVSLLLVEKKSLSTICEDDGSTIYDPARYHVEKENETAQAAEIASSTTNKPPNRSSSREKKVKPNMSTPTALHSLLATLPPSQLKRLEQIICTLLDKSNNEQKQKKEGNLKTAAREQEAVSLLNDVQAVDVAVNTTQLYVESVDSTTPHNPTIQSTTCTLSNPEGVNKISTAASRQSGSSKSSDDCQIVPMACAAGNDHTPSTGTKAASTKTIHGTSKRTLGDFASLLSLPHNATSQTAPPPPELAKQSADVSDRYSNLLASIQVVLDRQFKSRSKPAQAHSVTSAPSLRTKLDLNPQSVPNSGESICDYPLDTLNIRSQNSTPCVNVRQEPVNGQLTTATMSNDRVAHWLRTDTTESHVISRADQSNDLKDTQLSEAVLNSQLINHRYVNDTAFSENHSKCTLTPSLISANLCNYSLVDDHDITAAQLTSLPTQHCANSQLTTETDQSLFLAALVEKYLGLKIESSNETEEGRRPSNGDESAESLAVTRYGGLNPTDMSLATQCYLERHGILDKGCESKKNNKAFCSSTPVTGSPLVYPKPRVGRNHDRDDPHRYASRKQTQEAFYLPAATIPNILDGLNLDRSPLSDTNAKYIPDPRLLPSLSETSHLSNETCVAVGAMTRTKPRTDQMPIGEIEDGRILDIDRLRSLPKLL